MEFECSFEEYTQKDDFAKMIKIEHDSETVVVSLDGLTRMYIHQRFGLKKEDNVIGLGLSRTISYHYLRSAPRNAFYHRDNSG